MAEKIEHLTPEEEALIPTVRDEWIGIALATGPTDREAAQAAISDAYRLIAGIAPPKLWIWRGSPLEGCIEAWKLTELPSAKDQVGNLVCSLTSDKLFEQIDDKQEPDFGDRNNPAPVWSQMGGAGGSMVRCYVWVSIYNQVKNEISFETTFVERLMYAQLRSQIAVRLGDEVSSPEQARKWNPHFTCGVGHFEAASLSFYDFFRRLKRVKGLERLEPLMRAARSAGWWWPFEGACIVAERPLRMFRDKARRLHSADGPALAYPDGWSIHAWHGIPIPAWFIEDKQRITPDAIEAEANAELRRVMLEIFGFDRYIEARGAKLIAEDECLGLPRQLFEIDLAGERIRVLRVVNGTVEADGRQRQFHLGVPLECNTPHEAVAWSYGRPVETYREAVRT